MTELIVSPQSPFRLSHSSLLRPVPSIISSNFSQLPSPYAPSPVCVCVCDLPELYGHLWRLDKVASCVTRWHALSGEQQ